ncbi:MAG: DUF1552 domain-containing protein, partial [Planctomycetaceae bacterium]|nr:DUF1552 domain-containing protein [Planctomycetaceae bacterium]
MKKLSSLNRRQFLQGSGVALSLPTFESFAVAAATADKPLRRILAIGNHLGFHPPAFFPETAGVNYTSSATLKNIEKHRKNFTVFSNLDHGTTGGHSGVNAFLTGIRKEDSGGFPEKNVSLDQVAAEHSGSAARFPSITAGLGEGTDMCWTRSGVRIPPVNNPARLFEALFVENSKAQRDLERQRLGQRDSVLDALLESANSLYGNLNG